MTQAAKTVGYVKLDGPMLEASLNALRAAWANGDQNVSVLVPIENVPDVSSAPNRLYGAYINEDGDAV